MSIYHLQDQSQPNPSAKLRLENIIIDGSSPSLQFNGSLPEDTGLSHVLGIRASDKHLVRRPVSSIMVDTVYTSDGTLAGDRVVDADGNAFGIGNASDIELETTQLYLTNPPQTNNSNNQLLTRNAATGRVEEREVSSLPAGGSSVYDAIIPDDYALPSLAIAAGAVSLFVRNGTYTESADITLPSGFSMVGESSNTVIDLDGGANSFRMPSQTLYNTGTVSLTNGSAILAGSGTSWTGNIVSGDTIVIGALILTVSTVNSNNNITLTSTYLGPSESGLEYRAYTTSTLSIESVTFSNSTDLSGALIVRYARGFTLRNVSFVGGTGIGLSVTDSCYGTVDECNFAYGGTYALNLDEVNVVNVSKCYFTDASVFTMSVGESDALLVTNNTFSGGSTGIRFTAGTTSNCVISGNVIERMTNDGILVNQDVRMDKVMIQGNYISNCGQYGLSLDGNLQDSTFNDNHIFDNGNHGIFITSTNTTDNLLVSNNMVYGNGDSGMFIGTLAGSGIIVSGGSYNGNTNNGILSRCDDTTITGIYCRGNGGGIRLDNSAVDSTVTGCRVTGNTNFGIWLRSGLTTATVTGCNCLGNTTDNLLDDSTGAVLTGNRS